MATNRVKTLEHEIGRDLCRVRGEAGEYRGYQKDILTENFSLRDDAFMGCSRCQGIMREACFSSSGEQFCSCCKSGSEETYPSVSVRNMVLSLKCSCPLLVRGCDWLGNVRDCETHLDTCEYVQETCILGCGVVSLRNKQANHERNVCLQRVEMCEHCGKNLKVCDMFSHFDKCPKMQVTCDLKCGMIMCREDVSRHLEWECSEMVEKCRLGCGVKLTRSELEFHMTDSCVRRVTDCEHCMNRFRFCDLAMHVESCPKLKLTCLLECGKVLCLEDMEQHLEQDCGEMEIRCPFEEYECKIGLIKRKELNEHLKENSIEHLELKLNKMENLVKRQSELIAKQNGKISIQSDTIARQNGKIIELNKAISKRDRLSNMKSFDKYNS